MLSASLNKTCPSFLRWCQEHIRWRRVQWRRVLFSDESRFMLFRTVGRFRIYRRHNERYAANCVLVVVVSWYGQGFTMMVVLPCWELMESSAPRSTWDEIPQYHVVPLINVTGRIFQHDNARPHSAIVCQYFFYCKSTIKFNHSQQNR